MTMIEKLHLSGWKSIEKADVELGCLTVLIGANGAGKSNLISFFAFLDSLFQGRAVQHVFCEGRTEHGFCAQILAPHLADFGFLHVPPIQVAFSRKRGVIRRGGIRTYKPMRDDIVNTIKSRAGQDVFFTTMIDLYGLPRNFPGKAQHRRNAANPAPYVRALETAFSRDIRNRRFIPHLQLHEYETLLFANPQAFALAFEDCQDAIAALIAIADSFRTIEHINDGKTTAPSKRIIDVLPAYEGRKASAGPDIAEWIGMPA